MFLPRFGCCVWGWKGCVENPAALKGAFWICIFIFISNDKNRISDISVYSVHKECIYETIYISYFFESLGKFLSDWSDWFSVIPGSESQPQWALACRRLGESNLNLICFNQENTYCIYTVCIYIFYILYLCRYLFTVYTYWIRCQKSVVFWSRPSNCWNLARQILIRQHIPNTENICSYTSHIPLLAHYILHSASIWSTKWRDN